MNDIECIFATFNKIFFLYLALYCITLFCSIGDDDPVFWSWVFQVYMFIILIVMDIIGEIMI